MVAHAVEWGSNVAFVGLDSPSGMGGGGGEMHALPLDVKGEQCPSLHTN